MSVPFTLRPLLGPEAVFVFVVDLVVEVVVVVEVFHFLVVQLVLVQLVVEVLFELLVLLEVLELLVDVVAATLERPPHRRCHGQHRHPRLRLRLATRPWPAMSGRVCAVRSPGARACGAAPTTASLRSARRPQCTPAPTRG